MADGADVLLAEASFVTGDRNPEHLHMTGSEAAEIARRAGVGRLVLTHVPPWYDRETVLAEAAPQRLFSLPTGRKARLATLLGTFAVRPLGPAQPLGALPISTVRPAIVAALRGFERAQAFERWTIARQNVVLNQTICLRDQLPQPAAVDLTEYLPFLRIE
jgi:hypothetical protein